MPETSSSRTNSDFEPSVPDLSSEQREPFMDVSVLNPDTTKRPGRPKNDENGRPVDSVRLKQGPNKVERIPGREPLEFEGNEVTIGDRTFERGETLLYLPKKERGGDGTGKLANVVVLCGTIDGSGIIVQDLDNPGRVYHIGSKSVEEFASKTGQEIVTDERPEFNFKGEIYQSGEYIWLTTKAGKVLECVVLGTVKEGEGLILQSVNDPENPNDDHVFRVGKDTEIIKNPPPGPPPSPPPPGPKEAPDLVMMSTDEAMAQEARAKATEGRLEEKYEIDKKRAELKQKYSIFQTKVGSVVLGTFFAARHPVQSVFRQNLIRNVLQTVDFQKLISGERMDELSFGQKAEDATLERLSRAVSARERGEEWEAEQRLHGDTLQDEQSPEAVQLKADITDLIKKRITGGMSKEDFDEAKKQIYANAPWFRERQGQNGESVVHSIDNIDKVLEYVESLVAAEDHITKLEMIDEAMAGIRMITGETHMGARTEAKLGQMDKIVDKLTKGKIGRIIPDQTLAVAIVATGVLAGRAVTGVGGRIIKYGTFGAGASISALGVYARERLYLKQEESLVARQLAYSQQSPDVSTEYTPIREKMTEAQVDSLLQRDAVGVVKDFEDFLANLPVQGRSVAMTEAQARELLDNYVELDTSLKWGDVEGRDVMRYSSRENIESERSQVDEAMVQMRRILIDHYEVQHPDQLPAGFTLEEAIDTKALLYLESTIKPEATEKMDTFNTFARNRARNRAIATAVVGSTLGLAMKELVDLGIDKFNPRVIKGPNMPHVLPTEKKNIFGVDFNMPKRWNFAASRTGNGSAIIDSKNGTTVADGLQFDSKGGFTSESLLLLQQKGIKISSVDHVIHGEPKEIFVPNEDLNKLFGIKPISRTHYYNGTPMRPGPNGTRLGADFNELRVDIFKDPSTKEIVIRTRFKDGESWTSNGSTRVNPNAEIASGRAKIFISADKGTQGHPIVLDLKGQDLRLSPDDPIAQNFFDADGHLRASTLEVGAVDRVAPSGAYHAKIFATAEGEGVGGMRIKVPNDITVTETTMKFIEFLGGKDIKVPSDFPLFFIPTTSRFGVENIAVQNEEPGPNEVPPTDVPPPEPPSPPPPERNNNKAWKNAITDIPIDDEWRRLWGAVIKRMEDEGLYVDEMTFFDNNIATNDQTPVLESGPRPIAELPERSEIIIRVKDAKNAKMLIEGILGLANQDVNRLFGDFDELGERLRQGRYTLEDITAIRSALNVAEGRIGLRSNPETYNILRNILSVREYLDTLESEFSVERQTDLDIIYDLLNDMRRFNTLGFLGRETRQQAFGLLGNMARRVREGRLLSPDDYDALADALKQVQRHTLQAIDLSEETLLSAADSDETKAIISARCEASRTHLREITSTKLRALRSRKVTALGQIEAPPQAPKVAETETSTQPSEESPAIEATDLNPENTPPSNSRVNVGDIVDMGGGNIVRVASIDEDGNPVYESISSVDETATPPTTQETNNQPRLANIGDIVENLGGGNYGIKDQDEQGVITIVPIVLQEGQKVERGDDGQLRVVPIDSADLPPTK